MTLLRRNYWIVFICTVLICLYLIKFGTLLPSTVGPFRDESKCPFYKSGEKSSLASKDAQNSSRKKSSLAAKVGQHSSVDQHGGWKYDKALISQQHVAFDDGFARRIVQYVTRNTQNKGKPGNPPVTIGDIGAGVGQFGAWLRDNQVENVTWTGWDGGSNVEELEGKDVRLVGVSHYVIPHICYIDAAVDLKPFVRWMRGAPYDWEVSVEVGEHIPEAKAEVFMDNLVALARVGVILTWAVPGQGGFMHVNERDNKYVIDAMKKRGLGYNHDESMAMRKAVRHLSWLKNTILVFQK